MCGIAGIFNWKTGRGVDPKILEVMTKAISHRGPDWSAVWTEREIGLGMARLSIIGGNEANQPLWVDDGSLGIVLNGEIYNYKEINQAHGFKTTSDTMTLLKLYAKRGEDAFGDLAGMFACAIFDKKRRRLVLARDHFGKKPLFVCETNDGVAFASEIKPLLCLEGQTWELDMENVSEFLSLGYTAPDRTPVKKIFPFPAATWKSYGTTPGESVFWELTASQPDPSAEEEFYERFSTAVKRRLVADVPIGIFLSGGMDSNAVLSVALKQNDGAIARAFTIAPSEGASEAETARKTCAHAGIPLDEVNITHEYVINEIDHIVHVSDKLLANPPMFALDALSRQARLKVKVVLSGGGGDELFFGYPTWKADWIFRRFSMIPKPIRASLRAIVPHLPVDYSPHALTYALEKLLTCPAESPEEAHGWWRTIITGDELHSLNPDMPDVWNRAYKRAYGIAGTRFTGFPRQTTLSDLLVWWQGMGLYLADTIPMGRGVELRSPFMDHQLAEWTTRMPLERLYSPLKSKPFLREKLKPLMPEWVVKAAKKPFYIPLAQWMANQLSDFMSETLYGSRLLKEGLLQKKGVERLLEDHIGGKKDNSFKLLNLLVLVRWHEVVFLKNGRGSL